AVEGLVRGAEGTDERLEDQKLVGKAVLGAKLAGGIVVERIEDAGRDGEEGRVVAREAGIGRHAGRRARQPQRRRGREGAQQRPPPVLSHCPPVARPKRSACAILRRSPAQASESAPETVPGHGSRFIRSVAATSWARMPGSIAEWPASGTTTYSASGQARASSSAVTIGQTMS